MFITNMKEPPTREEVIEFILSLPEDMFCSSRRVEFDPVFVSVTNIDSLPDKGNMTPSRVEITFERDLYRNKPPHKL